MIHADGSVSILFPMRGIIVLVTPFGDSSTYISREHPEAQILPRKEDKPAADRRAQRGSVLLEFALCCPILLLLAVGGLELDFLALARQHVDFIASSAARCSHDAGCDVASNIYSNSSGLNVPQADISYTQDANGVTVNLVYHPFSPFLSNDVTLTARAQ
jgi:hypothetical protein